MVEWGVDYVTCTGGEVGSYISMFKACITYIIILDIIIHQST